MSAKFEICVATPFGPHVVDHATTQRDAEYRRMVAAEHQQARVFIREVKGSPHPLLDRYVETNAVAEGARERVAELRSALNDAEQQYDDAKVARNAAIEARSTAYSRYFDACAAESCEAHTFDMWTIHGEPEGPLG